MILVTLSPSLILILCFYWYLSSKHPAPAAMMALTLVKRRQLYSFEKCVIYMVLLVFHCNTFISHMKSSESHVHLFLCKKYHVSNILKLNMIFPLLPVLRSKTPLTSAGKITPYFFPLNVSVSISFTTQVTAAKICDDYL